MDEDLDGSAGLLRGLQVAMNTSIFFMLIENVGTASEIRQIRVVYYSIISSSQLFSNDLI